MILIYFIIFTCKNIYKNESFSRLEIYISNLIRKVKKEIYQYK
jgi:hypothetical protein